MIPSTVPIGLMRNGTAAGVTAVQPVFGLIGMYIG